MQARRIVVLLFHPRFENSEANRALYEAAQATEGVTCRDMYELYPDFHVDIETEKACIMEHDVVIWQHPFYWYSCPPLMKQWIDLVLEYGWAYGKDGNKLEGKYIMNALSSGGTFEIYRRDGRNRFTYRELLSPFDQTAFLCKMKYLPPFVVPGANRISPEDLDKFAAHYKEILAFLRDPERDLDSLDKVEYFNQLTPQSQWQEAYCRTR